MFARFAFDGYSTPALDEALDEKVPTLRGYLHLPGASIETARLVEIHYRDQGLTADDLVRMTAQDAIDRVGLEQIRERDAGETDGPTGTLVPTTFARQVTTAPIPAELPP